MNEQSEIFFRKLNLSTYHKLKQVMITKGQTFNLSFLYKPLKVKVIICTECFKKQLVGQSGKFVYYNKWV